MCLLRDRRVERRIEDGDVRHAGKCAPCVIQRGEGGRVVEGSELTQLAESGFDFVIDDDRVAVARSAVHDPVSDSHDVCRSPLE
jgi:hypothetical protein